MATLNTFQKLTRVLPGMPFGSGADGAYSSATIPTLTKDSCSGTATSNTLTTTSATFANGDILLLHQTRGTGVGQWEINRVSGGGGTTSLTLQTALQYTYTDSGNSQAQVIKIPQYTDLTVQTGTWTVPAWDGNVGGIFPIAVNGVVTITGTATSTAVGFRGGAAVYGGNISGYSGEGSSGASARASSANGNGGGAGHGSVDNGFGAGSGAGGGHATDGANATGYQGNGYPGTRGLQVGSADLTSLFLGGGGGGAIRDNSGSIGSGANGAGIILIFGKTIATITGSITANGNNGETGAYGSGGGGAGGSILIVCQSATLGTNKLVATKGSGGTGGGDGADGRIAIHHSGIITGTSNPSFTDVTDPTLVETGGAFLFNVVQ